MDDTILPQRRPPQAWAAVAVCAGFLCYSAWVMRSQTTPEGFLARNGIIFLGIAMTVWATANLLAPASRFKSWLRVVWWACIALSFVSQYLRTH